MGSHANYSNFVVNFYPTHCMIQDTSNKRMIGRAKKLDGLYVHQANELEVKASSILINKVSFHNEIID